MSEAARELKVGVGVVRTMIEHRLLPAQQPAKGTPWLIQRDDLHKEEVRNYANHAHTGKAVPRGADSQTIMPYL
jgi:excisionase family DNA binding protein